MGLFLATSAFKIADSPSLIGSCRDYCSKHGVSTSVLDRSAGEINADVDATFFAPRNLWTVVLWPNYFNIHDLPICEEISRELSVVSSTLHVYGGSYWHHALFVRGQQVDQFASIPGYFSENEEEAAKERKVYKGDSRLIARHMGVSEDIVSPYLVHVNPDSESPLGKAFPDDEFERDDIWVLADFWKRLGIAYPEDVDKYEQRVRFDKGFGNKLPMGGGL